MSFFSDTGLPRVFALPPGCDFAKEFVRGLLARQAGLPPENLARTEIYLNTGEVRRGVLRALTESGPALLPRIRLVTELALDRRFYDIPRPVPSLRRRLELFQAVAKLLEQDERFGSRPSTFDLADSLAQLMDEMHAEGVIPDRIAELDVSAHSAHWNESVRFLKIIDQFWGRTEAPDRQARQRMVAERLVESWRSRPPAHPIIVAGSTGSRGATRLLMQAAAALPQGAVVLPCFDFELPAEVWAGMAEAETSEDHPQFRFKHFMDQVGTIPGNVALWYPEAATSVPRNRLVSLALRPAPVTNHWLTEGPGREAIAEATENLTLVEAPNPRAEATAIALRLREAAESGMAAALVTPDRSLIRQVKAALSRWKIEPDDRSGTPLAETPRGRLFAQTAALLGREIDAASLIALLRHPVVHSAAGRQEHLLRVDQLECRLRRDSVAAAIRQHLCRFFGAEGADAADAAWRGWLTSCLADMEAVTGGPLEEIVSAHRRLADRLALGATEENAASSVLWQGDAGQPLFTLLAELYREGPAAGHLDVGAYRHLFLSLIRSESIPAAGGEPHPGIAVWTTLDARMQSRQLVIASGLNEGAWPAPAPIDPWLNRDLRRQAGLLMPERITGLSAHDFYQAVSARNVVLTRSIRSAGAPTVPSRWLIRLTNLLDGIGEAGEAALAGMRERGRLILQTAKALEEPAELQPKAARPNPKPEVEHRPKRLSVTEIKTLISNPYEIYAKHVLDLRELNPLHARPGAALRGNAIHRILELFIREVDGNPGFCTVERLLAVAEDTLTDVSAPIFVKRLWVAQLAAVGEEFIGQELRRMSEGISPILESRGESAVDGVDFTLVAKADRIDRKDSGQLALYDYKTGTIPGLAAILNHDKQIPLTAAMLERGGFDQVPPAAVDYAAYIKVGRTTDEREVPRQHGADGADLFAETWRRLARLIAHYRRPETGYLSRLNMRRLAYGAAYDHLARYGEWDETVNIEEDG